MKQLIQIIYMFLPLVRSVESAKGDRATMLPENLPDFSGHVEKSTSEGRSTFAQRVVDKAEGRRNPRLKMWD